MLGFGRRKIGEAPSGHLAVEAVVGAYRWAEQGG